MSIRKTIPHSEGIYFITFTCYQWQNLFIITNGYDIVYTQFDILKKEGNYILGYVIMPNHVHALIGFKNSGKTINNRIGTMKRFMAYEIINRLKTNREDALLHQLANSVNSADKKRGKLHEVFESSFDSKHCITMEFIQQKLDYIHNNPCVKKWQLADNPADYPHSSANYYNTGTQGIYPVTNYMALQDIDLTVL
jgi:REP element-mobilizing transposase RayT